MRVLVATALACAPAPTDPDEHESCTLPLSAWCTDAGTRSCPTLADLAVTAYFELAECRVADGAGYTIAQDYGHTWYFDPDGALVAVVELSDTQICYDVPSSYSSSSSTAAFVLAYGEVPDCASICTDGGTAPWWSAVPCDP